MKLAIKGHPTRGKEVIEILEMLGGINELDLKGIEADSHYYVGGSINRIYRGLGIHLYDYIIYSLEEFLEKFPYKVGDKVSSKYLKNYKIVKMEWEDTNNRVIYKLQGMGWYNSDELEYYKEETMEEDKKAKKYCTEESEDSGKTEKIAWFTFWDNNFADEVELYLEDRELVQKDGKWFVVKKKKKYPKTYEECCKIIDYYLEGTTIIGYNKYLLERFQQLLICRDAYWKIAGEQMGLGKDWKPDWNNGYVEKYYIYLKQNEIEKSSRFFEHHFLAFPTEEIRDIFYENFKELIENCKELL